jgi:predicted RNA binding protein YcfA (HicA-like mRNA interferase family)
MGYNGIENVVPSRSKDNCEDLIVSPYRKTQLGERLFQGDFLFSGLDNYRFGSHNIWGEICDSVRGYSTYMKVREVMKLLKADGWYHLGTEGDHRQYKHPVKRGRVTVAGKPSDDVHPKTLASIFEQAQLERKR